LTRPQVLVIGAVALLAAGCWALSAVRMRGMDAGPGGDLGATGWFLATWVVMMAAMMLPVLTPLLIRYEPRRGQALTAHVVQRAAFFAGYLAVWVLAGLLAYELVSLVRHGLGKTFAWGNGGRWAVVAVLTVTAAYQLTGHKRRALDRCRRTSAAGEGPAVAGLRAGANCLDSSWLMMAALFALGVMSLWWMAVVAVLIAAERLPRSSAPGRRAGIAILLALAIGVAVAPASVPGLTVPGGQGAMPSMMMR
jgi:predicted metal-binding membrane protein